jgi:hypothetical protein
MFRIVPACARLRPIVPLRRDEASSGDANVRSPCAAVPHACIHGSMKVREMRVTAGVGCRQEQSGIELHGCLPP